MVTNGTKANSGSAQRAKIWGILTLALLLAAAIVAVALATVRDRDAHNVAAGMAPLPSVAPAAPSVDPDAIARRVVVIGDSYVAGSDMGGRGKTGWPSIVEQDLATSGMPTRITIAAVGGTGYEAQNAGIDFGKIAGKVSDTETLRDTELVIFMGSRNDVVYPPDKVAEAARATFATTRLAMPGAKFIVVGPEWQDEAVPSQLLAIRDAISSEAIAVGAEFVDPLTPPWFTLASPDLIGKDNIHPTDAGHRKIASVLYPIIKAALEEKTS